MSFDDMAASEKVEYLRDCIPLIPYNEVVDQNSQFSEETVIELLSRSKELVKEQMESGFDQWEYLIDNSEYTEEELLSLPYRDLLYYSVAMGDSNIKTYPVDFEFEDSEIASRFRQGGESEVRRLLREIDHGEMNLALSRVGVDIWGKMENSSTMRFAKVEDADHVFVQYWFRTGTEKKYHERNGEFVDFPTIRRVNCRLHLDDEFLEMSGRNDRKTDRRDALRDAENVLGNEITVNEDGLEVDDNTIRHFLGLADFSHRPHAKKAGTSESSWSATERDVTDDDGFPTSRPNDESNFQFDTPSLGEIGFNLSADDNSFRIFDQLMLPQRHIRIAQYIREKIGEAS